MTTIALTKRKKSLMKTYHAVVSVGLKKVSDFGIVTTIEKRQDKRDETDSGHVVYIRESVP